MWQAMGVQYRITMARLSVHAHGSMEGPGKGGRDMGEKEKGRKEQKKKAQLSPKEKRKLKREKRK